MHPLLGGTVTLGEAVDVDSEAYCWRWSGFFWRMRASLGLACAQATTLCTQVFGQARSRSLQYKPTISLHPRSLWHAVCEAQDFLS